MKVEDIGDNLILHELYNCYADEPSGNYVIAIRGIDSKDDVKSIMDIIKLVLIERQIKK